MKLKIYHRYNGKWLKLLRKILERAVEEKFKGDVDITDGGTSLNGKQADFVFNLHEDRFSVNINKLK